MNGIYQFHSLLIKYICKGLLSMIKGTEHVFLSDPTLIGLYVQFKYQFFHLSFLYKSNVHFLLLKTVEKWSELNNRKTTFSSTLLIRLSLQRYRCELTLAWPCAQITRETPRNVFDGTHQGREVRADQIQHGEGVSQIEIN